MYKTIFFNLLFCISFATFSQEQLTDFVTSQSDGGAMPEGYMPYNGMLIFTASTPDTGLELWGSDGTSEGTLLIKDIYPGSTGSIKSRKPVVLNNTVYFFADNGSTGTQLWKSDGTAAGTVRITDFLTGTTNRLTVVDNQLFFVINTSVNIWEIWKSDGTAASTVPVKTNIAVWNQPDGFMSAGGLFYVTLQPPNGNTTALWRSDGTEAGTFSVINSITGNGAGEIDGFGGTSYLTQFIEYNNELYFVARSETLFGSPNSVGILKTHGTVSGTLPVVSVYNGGELIEYADVLEWQGKLYFSFFESSTNHYLIWETNGTESGTKKVYEVINNTYFTPSNLCANNVALLFAGPSPSGGSSLMTLNPGNGQTKEVKIISNASQKPVIFRKNLHTSSITKGGNLFLINALKRDSTSFIKIRSIYLSDGTPAGTFEIEKPTQISAGTGLQAFYLNGAFYFTVNELSTGAELWKSDGTLEGLIC